MDLTEETTIIVRYGNFEKRVPKGATSKMFGWSKWGGKNLGLVQENKTQDWTCQACGQKQTDHLPSYMFEFLPREFIRICTNCQFVVNTEQILAFDDLLTHVKKHLDW